MASCLEVFLQMCFVECTAGHLHAYDSKGGGFKSYSMCDSDNVRVMLCLLLLDQYIYFTSSMWWHISLKKTKSFCSFNYCQSFKEIKRKGQWYFIFFSFHLRLFKLDIVDALYSFSQQRAMLSCCDWDENLSTCSDELFLLSHSISSFFSLQKTAFKCACCMHSKLNILQVISCCQHWRNSMV